MAVSNAARALSQDSWVGKPSDWIREPTDAHHLFMSLTCNASCCARVAPRVSLLGLLGGALYSTTTLNSTHPSKPHGPSGQRRLHGVEYTRVLGTVQPLR